MADGVQNEDLSSSRGGSKIVPLMLLVNSLLVAGVIVLFLTRGGGQAKGPAPAEAGHAEPGAVKGSAAPGPTARLADFVVHLRNAEADRYARVSFEIEIGTEEERPTLTAYMPRIRDSFITYLSDRTVDELRGSEAIEKTKTVLAERLAKLAPGVNVRALYVTDLVIQ